MKTTTKQDDKIIITIDKAANQDNRTINSWIINIIKQHIDNVKK